MFIIGIFCFLSFHRTLWWLILKLKWRSLSSRREWPSGNSLCGIKCKIYMAIILISFNVLLLIFFCTCIELKSYIINCILLISYSYICIFYFKVYLIKNFLAYFAYFRECERSNMKIQDIWETSTREESIWRWN